MADYIVQLRIDAATGSLEARSYNAITEMEDREFIPIDDLLTDLSEDCAEEGNERVWRECLYSLHLNYGFDVDSWRCNVMARVEDLPPGQSLDEDLLVSPELIPGMHSFDTVPP